MRRMAIETVLRRRVNRRINCTRMKVKRQFPRQALRLCLQQTSISCSLRVMMKERLSVIGERTQKKVKIFIGSQLM